MSALAEQVAGDHYKRLAIQPVEYCFKNDLGAIESNVIKYVTRHKFKDGKKDIEKAIHNLKMLLELMYPEMKPGPEMTATEVQERIERYHGSKE